MCQFKKIIPDILRKWLRYQTQILLFRIKNYLQILFVNCLVKSTYRETAY